MGEEIKRFLQDRGYKSRKLLMSVFVLVVILAGAVIAGRWPAFGVNYGTYVGGCIGVLALYLTGNVSGKFVVAKEMISKLGVEVPETPKIES